MGKFNISTVNTYEFPGHKKLMDIFFPSYWMDVNMNNTPKGNGTSFLRGSIIGRTPWVGI